MLKRGVQLAVALALVAAFVATSHPGELWGVLKDVDLKYCAAAAALNVAVLVLTPVRSSLLFRALGHDVPREVLVPATILGFVAGGLTPAASGELLRAQALQGRAGVPLRHGVAAVAYERTMSIYVLVVSGVLIFALQETHGAIRALAAAGIVVTLFVPTIAAGVAGRLAPATAASGDEAAPASVRGRLLFIASRLRSLLADTRLLARFLPLSLAITALVAAQYWLLTKGVGGGVGLGDVWLAYAVSAVAGIAAFIPLGLGVLDASLAVMLDRLGMTLEQGGIVALLVRGFVTLPLVLAALVSFLYLQRAERPDKGKPRSMLEEAQVQPNELGG